MMGVSLMATITLGTLTYVGNRALNKLDEAGDQAAKAIVQLEAQGKRLDSVDMAIGTLQRQVGNVQQRISKIEGRGL